MTEAELQQAVGEMLTLFGWRFCHFRPARTEKGWRTAIQGDKGFPDIVAVRPTFIHEKPSRLLFAELKGERGQFSDEQERWLDDLFLTGIEGSYGCGEHECCTGVRFEVYRWRPSDWADGTIEGVLR